MAVQRWFADRGVRTKVHLAVAVVALVACAVGLQALLRLSDANDRMNAITGVTVPRLKAVADVRGAQAAMNDAAAQMLASRLQKSSTLASSAKATFQAGESDMRAAMTLLGRYVTTDADRKLYDALKTNWQTYDSSARSSQFGLEPLAGVTAVSTDSMITLVANMRDQITQLAANA
ncbi:MCP four helix bundle domain-containing protein, partial [Actinoplanes siamensis]